MNYNNIQYLELETSCVNVNLDEWENLMDGHVRADKNKINTLVKNHLPDLYNHLALNYPNPYDYYRTKTHLILVHSMIEYFIKYNY